MRNFDQSPYDIKKTVKTGLVYLLIAFPFVLIVATVLAVVDAPLAIIMICNILVGGVVILLEIIIHNKIKQKRQNQQKSNFDPFRD